MEFFQVFIRNKGIHKVCETIMAASSVNIVSNNNNNKNPQMI